MEYEERFHHSLRGSTFTKDRAPSTERDMGHGQGRSGGLTSRWSEQLRYRPSRRRSIVHTSDERWDANRVACVARTVTGTEKLRVFRPKS